MRYTRYNYKPPKKKNNFMFVIILIIIAAIALGTILSKLLPKNIANTATGDNITKTDLQKDSVGVSEAISVSGIKGFVAIQCGFFSDKEKALVLKNSLMKFGTPFIIEEDKSNRVLFGIYPKESIDVVIKQLQANKIEFVKVNFQLTSKDSTSAQTNEMISADIKILNRLSEKDANGFDTVEFKKWLLALQGADEKSINYANMSEIKTYLTALPSVVKKEKAEEGYVYIYKFIKKIST
ncbi:SPOR domain-containing protein [Clostridium sp.]|uniref:SPOR domain-containing protein n=1 Tax=Clostridium sp. TaxID=1506 RepID=UPI003D6C711C